MRETISAKIEAFAKGRKFNYATNIVPTELAGGIKYPCILWVAPDAEYRANQGRWVFRSTFYIVENKVKDEQVAGVLDKLEDVARDLYMMVRDDEYIYAESSMTCRPKVGFDNTGAVAVELTFTIYANEC